MIKRTASHPRNEDRSIAFGDVRFMPDENRLCGNGAEHRLENKQVQVLLYLLAHAGDLVTKEALLAFGWEQKFVGDDVLAVAISHVRKALGDDARRPRYIKTEPKRGYRFIAALDPVEKEKAGLLLQSGGGAPPLAEASNTMGDKRSFLYAVTALVLTITIGLVVSRSLVVSQPTPSELLAQARVQLSGSSVEEWRAAHQLFGRILEADESQVGAYTGMVQAELKILAGQGRLLFEARTEMRDLLLKAASIAPRDPHIPYLLATVYFQVFRDFAAADQQYQQSLSLRGDAAYVWSSYAQFRLAMGDFDGALAALNKARALDPLLHGSVQAVWLLNMQRRYDEAQLALQKLLAVQPDTLLYHVSAQSLYENIGDDGRSFDHLARILTLAGYSEADTGHARGLFQQGGLAAVYAWLAATETPKHNIGQYEAPLSLARYAIKAGNLPAALDHLEAALADRQLELLWIGVDPKYDSLRGDPRFQAVLKELGLPQATAKALLKKT